MSENDMKIYQSNKKDNSVEKMTEIFDLVNLHRENGNLEKARLLGAKLAHLTPSEGDSEMNLNLEKILPQRYQTQDILYQIKVLLVFAVEKTLKEEINPSFLSIMAINAMHDRISEKHPAFFKNLTDGAAFTFYRLALGKCGEMDENIGEAFAMLCNAKKNTDGFVETGRMIWKMAIEAIENEIKKAAFVKTEA